MQGPFLLTDAGLGEGLVHLRMQEMVVVVLD